MGSIMGNGGALTPARTPYQLASSTPKPEMIPKPTRRRQRTGTLEDRLPSSKRRKRCGTDPPALSRHSSNQASLKMKQGSLQMNNSMKLWWNPQLQQQQQQQQQQPQPGVGRQRSATAW